MMDSNSQRIVRTDANGLATLTLNRPDKLNALDTQAFKELNAHLEAQEKETDRIGCVVIKGAGRGFCAGADLAAMGKVPVPTEFKPGVIDRLGRLPQPVIAAIRRYAWQMGTGRGVGHFAAPAAKDRFCCRQANDDDGPYAGRPGGVGHRPR